MVMKLSWCLASSFPDLLSEACLCEAVNLDGVWYPDYQAPFSGTLELYVTLTSVALKTSRVFIGSMVTDVLRRHPMVTAHAFASLSCVAPKRIVLGLGAGAGTSHFRYGIKLNDLAMRLKEGINVIKLLWKSTPDKPANFKGKHFSLEKAGPPLKPASNIPIYVASYGPKMIEITAELANGWIPESHTPITYRLTLDKIYSLMKKFGRKVEELEPCLAAIFYPFEPNEKSYKRILNAAKHYLAAYPDIQWIAGYGRNHPGLRTQQLVLKPKLWDELASQVPDNLADSTIIYGKIEECVDKIARFRDAGCGHMILEPYWIEKDKLREAIEIAGNKIKPSIENL
ncbi:MAG: LLM class flavin-dependent oxidoreductase [Thaumarchaeota archaeon]|jgi:phthiodiolone/phenolphthiodiolone dimycocerosates ketoreductase|nr:LLM class flavin-dependent oxidoreductase [Candidatus Geocrenenecus arthurdayi]